MFITVVFFTLQVHFSFKGLSMTTTLAQSYQHVANNYKYIQYNQTLCSRNHAFGLTVSMLVSVSFSINQLSIS